MPKNSILGSLASFDTSSVLNTEGVPLLEETEFESASNSVSVLYLLYNPSSNFVGGIVTPVLRIRIRRIRMIFGPPGSISVRYLSGSSPGSFYHQEKIVRKNLIPSAMTFYF